MCTIAVGGLGGSGTRVYAKILKTLGYFIGSDLNEEEDNLLFTRLLKDPQWYKQATVKDVQDRLFWFKEIMSGNSLIPKLRIEKAISKNKTFPSCAYHLDTYHYTKRNTWAWKEPNSHIYLKHYKKVFPKLKFILVIRNGLDMALSSNIQQLTNWGGLLYDISFTSGDTEETYHAQLDYWIAANDRAIKDGQLYLGADFLVCNFDKLCKQPEFEISRIMRFLGHKATNKLLKELVQLPKLPESTGRYLRSGIKFSSELLRKVHRLNAGQPL